jgi:hypothetical protein
MDGKIVTVDWLTRGPRGGVWPAVYQRTRQYCGAFKLTEMAVLNGFSLSSSYNTQRKNENRKKKFFFFSFLFDRSSAGSSSSGWDVL